MKWRDDLAGCEGVLELLRLDAVPATRELVSITSLLAQARELVSDEAHTRSLRVVVVAVPEEVVVSRVQVVLVVAALLRRAIRRAPPGGRVAITAQEIERDLVFAVYDAGTPRMPSSRFDDFAAEAASLVGGRVWSAPVHDGNLALLSLPLDRELN